MKKEEQKIIDQLLLEENGGCVEPFIGCGIPCGIPGCLLPIVGLVTAMVIGISALLG